MSLMTWVPGLLLFSLQGYLEGWGWMGDNARLASGLFFGAWIWIGGAGAAGAGALRLGEMEARAGALMFGVFFVAADSARRSTASSAPSGATCSISQSDCNIWLRLFEGDNHTTSGAVFFRVRKAKSCLCGAAGRAGRALPGVPVHAGPQDPRRGGGAVNESLVTFTNVSRFYGEVLGINNVSLTIPPGITSPW